MRSNSIWNRLHAVIELLILIGFVIGLIPFLYGWAATWVIPLTLISAALAFLLGNGVLLLAIANVIMSVLSIIPLIGYAPRIIGIFIALINIAILSRRSRY
jgi:hypothetical protein